MQPRQPRSYASIVTRLVMALAATVMACTLMACVFDSPPLFEPDTPESINQILNMAPITSLDESDSAVCRCFLDHAPSLMVIAHP